MSLSDNDKEILRPHKDKLERIARANVPMSNMCQALLDELEDA